MKVTVEDDLRGQIWWRAHADIQDDEAPDDSLLERDYDAWDRAYEECVAHGEAEAKRRVSEVVQWVRDAAGELCLERSVAEVHLSDKTEVMDCEVELCTGADGNVVKIYLDPAIPLDARTIRHEMMHARDQLDPAFQYDPALAQRVVRECVGTVVNAEGEKPIPLFLLVNELWNVNADGRLGGRGCTKEERRCHFLTTFPSAQGQHWEVFERLWDSELVPYPELVELAREFAADGTWCREGTS